MNEKILNKYYNVGGFNNPKRIGYIMDLIRKAKPLTELEWRIYYFSNIHSENFLRDIAREMAATIPPEYEIETEQCFAYVCDVMFRRTFLGYNKEKQALRFLQKEISSVIQESPKEWDSRYFIDFFFRNPQNTLIGIQLKPESFYVGQYEKEVDIQGKMRSFRNNYHARTYILIYSQEDGCISFTNPDVIIALKKEAEKLPASA